MKRALFLFLICCLVTLFSLASADVFVIQDVIKKNNGTSIIIKAPIDYIRMENVKVSLKENDSTSFTINNIASITDSQDVFTSWYFVLDVDSEWKNTALRITESLIDRIKEKDNAQVVNAAQGETILDTLITDRDDLKKSAESIINKANGKSKPALTATINEILEAADYQKCDRICVVLISNFTKDDNAYYDRLEDNLKSTKASLYLVQYARKAKANVISPLNTIINKLGIGASIKLSDSNEDAAGNAKVEIDKQEKKYKVVSVDGDVFENTGTLVMTISDNTSMKYSAEYIMGGIASQEPISTPKPDTPPPKPIWEKIIQYIKDNPINSAFFGVISILVVILICLLIRGATKKKKDNREKDEVIQEETSPQKTALIHSEISKPVSEVSEMFSQINQSEANGYIPTEIDPMRNQNAGYGLEVSVISADGRFRSMKKMTNTMALGRNPEANLGYNPERTDMHFPEDYGKISNCHALLTYEHGVMYIEDVSRNGTWINGIKVSGRVPIKSGSNLTLGRADFQIMWK